MMQGCFLLILLIVVVAVFCAQTGFSTDTAAKIITWFLVICIIVGSVIRLFPRSANTKEIKGEDRENGLLTQLAKEQTPVVAEVAYRGFLGPEKVSGILYWSDELKQYRVRTQDNKTYPVKLGSIQELKP